jgi:trigger factor
VKQQVAQQRKAQADQEIEDQVLGKILEEAQVELPEAMVESEANICVQQFAAEISAKSMSIEQFCQQTGKTLDGIRKEMYPLARRRIQLRLVLAAIAKEEHLEATEEELEGYWDQMSQQYGLPKDQLKRYMGDGVEEEMRQDLMSQKAYALLRESTILVRE